MSSKNNELYNYLSDNFENCKVIENGGYYAKDTSGNEYFFSSDCTTDSVNLVSYYPGVGGSYSDASVLRNELLDGGVSSNQAVVIASNYHDSSNVLESFDKISSDMGINVSGAVFANFSGSTPTVFERSNSYLANHPEVSNASVVVIDGYYTDEITNSGVRYDELINRNVPITFAGPVGDGYRVKNICADFGDLDYNSYYIQENTKGGHVGTNKAILEDGLLDFIVGSKNSISNASRYSFEKYDSVSQEFSSDGVSLDEICFSGVANINIDSILDSKNDFHLEEVPSEYAEKYGYLSLLENRKISYVGDENDANSVAITSDLQYIENFANSLIKSIKTENMHNLTKLQTSAACGPLLNIIGKYMGSYYDSVGTLLDTLSLEADAIISIGQSMADMDMDLRGNVQTEIDDGILIDDETFVGSGSVNDENTLSNVIGGVGIGAGVIAETVLDKEEKTIVDNGESSSILDEEVYISDNEYVSNVDVQNELDEISSTNSGVVSNEQVLVQGNVSENIVYERDDYKVLVSYENGDIKSMKYLYEYDSVDDASKTYEFLLSKYSKENYVNKILLNNNKIEVIFNDNSIKGIDIDDLLEKYKMEGIDS